MGLREALRRLAPDEGQFYSLLEQHGRLSHQAATALLGLVDQPAASVAEAVQRIEHAADELVRAMEDALARTFVTPIDREDLHRLTGDLDEVVDLCNGTARAFHLYAVGTPTAAMLQLIGRLQGATRLFEELTPLLRRREYAALLEGCRGVHRLEKEADAVYRAALAHSFRASDPEGRAFFKQKEALDTLEGAMNHCDRVADVLSALAVKHG